ncbi:MAG: hypothetical protein HYU87_01280 [Chloroflexi bacterium]|nr:hypothetical protein [Chloroflexota bacterium]
MGAQIGAEYALAGHDVVLVTRSPSSGAAALQRAHAAIRALVAHGLVGEARRRRTYARHRPAATSSWSRSRRTSARRPTCSTPPRARRRTRRCARTRRRSPSRASARPPARRSASWARTTRTRRSSCRSSR